MIHGNFDLYLNDLLPLQEMGEINAALFNKFNFVLNMIRYTEIMLRKYVINLSFS